MVLVFILFSSYSYHMFIGTKMLEESALLSLSLVIHSLSSLPYQSGRGFRESLVSGRVPGSLCFAGKFDVAAITYCPCSYPVYARETSFVNKCKELITKI